MRKFGGLIYSATFFFSTGTYDVDDEKCQHDDDDHASYSDQEDINYAYGASCNKLMENENLGTAYEDSCNTKNSLCLYKNYVTAAAVNATSVVVDHHQQTHYLNTVDNNNYNISYSGQVESQYASCSSHNISMISSACYTTTQTMSYPSVGYSSVYPIKDVNKNYEEVKLKLYSSSEKV